MILGQKSETVSLHDTYDRSGPSGTNMFVRRVLCIRRGQPAAADTKPA